MIKIDIISGFLGAGKTTLIKRILKTNLTNEKTILIENEFGEIGIDAGFLSDVSINVKEINQGCICCSLQGDFSKALAEVVNEYNPDRIIIEPSGVGKLSDIIKAVKDSNISDYKLNALVCVCDASKAKMYLRNFGEFYNDQVLNAKTIFLTRTDVAKKEKVEEALELLRKINENALIVSTNLNVLSDEVLVDCYEAIDDDFEEDLLEEVKTHHHHHHDHDCGCGCHDHHHDHDHNCECGCHDHHHDHDCECGCHGHHHAEEVFTSFGLETAKSYTYDELNTILEEITENDEYGIILRAKGIVDGNNVWYHFDVVPGQIEIREGKAGAISKICVIGTKLNKDLIKSQFLK